MKSFKIALTGSPGIGKTTLFKLLCESFDHSSFVGFYTDEVRDASGRRIGFDIVKFNGDRHPLSRVGLSSRFHVGQYGVDVLGFEKFALGELKGAKIVVIDEIGKMECLSHEFQSIVEKLIASDASVLCTIPVPGRGRPIPLVEKVRNDFKVFVVTRENRDRLGSEIKALLN